VQLVPSPYPTWSGSVQLLAGANVQLKFVKGDDRGNVVWEPGPNRTLKFDTDSMVRASWK
jgi:alpha-amylase